MALTSTEVSNIHSRSSDSWVTISNPNDFALAQTELPNNSVNESGSTGAEIDFTDNEFLIHGFETVSGSSSGYDMNTQRTSGYGQATSYSGVEATGYVGYNPSGTWHYRTAFFFDVSAVPTGATITDATLRYDSTGGNGASNCSIQVLSVGSSDSGSAIYDGVIAGTEVVNSTWCEVSAGNDYTVSLGNLGTVSGSELALGFSTIPTTSSNKNIIMADAELDFTYELSSVSDKSTNSITVGTVAGGVLLAEQTQLDNDDQLNSNTIEDWGIVVGSSSPMVGEDIVQVDFYGKRYQLSGYNQMCEFEVLDSSDSAKYEHSFVCED